MYPGSCVLSIWLGTGFNLVGFQLGAFALYVEGGFLFPFYYLFEKYMYLLVPFFRMVNI